MALAKTLGESMAETAGYAMLAHSMDQQAAQLGQARHSLEAMTQYAQGLQADNQTLYRLFLEHDHDLTALKTKFNEMKADRDRLADECQQLTEQNQNLKQRNQKLESDYKTLMQNGEESGELYVKQVDYMRNLKKRLVQTEKALVHSSSKSVGLAHLKDFLLQATAALENHKDLSQEAMDVMERAYEQFMESGQLTPDDDMQKVLEELKITAPDFKPGLAN